LGFEVGFLSEVSSWGFWVVGFCFLLESRDGDGEERRGGCNVVWSWVWDVGVCLLILIRFDFDPELDLRLVLRPRFRTRPPYTSYLRPSTSHTLTIALSPDRRNYNSTRSSF
jgi:hypothetical protein